MQERGSPVAGVVATSVYLADLFVPGIPIPQGSTTRSRYGKTYADNAKRLYPWRDLVAARVRAELHDWLPPVATAADVRLAFRFPRPAKHYGRRGGQPYLRADAEPYPTRRYTTGDLDKLERALLDALTAGGALADDALVIGLASMKRWADELHPAGVTLTVLEHFPDAPG